MEATHRHHQGLHHQRAERIHRCPHNHHRQECHTMNLFAYNYALPATAVSRFLHDTHLFVFLNFPVLYPVRYCGHHGLDTSAAQAMIWLCTFEQTKSLSVDTRTSQLGVCARKEPQKVFDWTALVQYDLEQRVW